MKKRSGLGCVLGTLAALLLTSPTMAQDSDGFAGTAAVTVGNHGGVVAKPLTSFDISFVDINHSLYVLGDRTNNAIDMVNTTNNQFLGFCGAGQFQGFTGNNNTSGPDGVLIVPNANAGAGEIWAGDGNSTVKVFRLPCTETSTPYRTITTGQPSDNRADEMCYDPRNNRLMVANNAASPPFVSIINTTTYTVVKKIAFDGTNNTPNSTNGVEQCQWSPKTGQFYVTVPGVDNPDSGHGVVVVIDYLGNVAKTLDIPLANCSTPQGMAIGPGDDILVGCNGLNSPQKSSVIIQDGNGTLNNGQKQPALVLATVPNEAGPDEVWYNNGNKHYFLAKSGQTPTALGIIDALSRTADVDITGPGRNHSVAADSAYNKTFFPVVGNATLKTPGLCGKAGGSDAMGCILVVTQPPGTSDPDNTGTPSGPVANNQNTGNCVAQGGPSVTAGTQLTGTCK